jgi:hypothetical protein
LWQGALDIGQTTPLLSLKNTHQAWPHAQVLPRGAGAILQSRTPPDAPPSPRAARPQKTARLREPLSDFPEA